jgi:hypothetical protein
MSLALPHVKERYWPQFIFSDGAPRSQRYLRIHSNAPLRRMLSLPQMLVKPPHDAHHSSAIIALKIHEKMIG